MAVDLFLKLAGIEGESVDSKHKGEIDVLAWSWGLSQDPPSGTGSGGGAGRVKIENISVQKLVDLASPLLLSFTAQGKRISDGTLTTRKPGKAANEFLLLKMQNVMVTSVHVNVAEEGSAPTENVTFSFGKVEFTYRASKPDGSAGTEKSFKWDVAQNKPF
jgi:type VI secretion system secreted protein Hcp